MSKLPSEGHFEFLQRNFTETVGWCQSARKSGKCGKCAEHYFLSRLFSFVQQGDGI